MKKSLLAVTSALFLFTACKEDNTPEPVNEEELITTVIVTFIPHAGTEVYEFRFEDLDGDGGNAPVITNDTLPDSTMYHVSVQFLNESVNPAEDITEEVEEEGPDHQVFFLIGSGLDMDYEYDDTDTEGNPIGLKTIFTTGAAGSGNLSLVLRHEPDKDGESVSEGDITHAGGETDVEVSFDVTVQ